MLIQSLHCTFTSNQIFGLGQVVVVNNHFADFKNVVLCFCVIPNWKNLLDFNLGVSLDLFKGVYKMLACLIKVEHFGLRSGSLEYILVYSLYFLLFYGLNNLGSCLHLFNKFLVYIIVVVEHQHAHHLHETLETLSKCLRLTPIDLSTQQDKPDE